MVTLPLAAESLRDSDDASNKWLAGTESGQSPCGLLIGRHSPKNRVKVVPEMLLARAGEGSGSAIWIVMRINAKRGRMALRLSPQGHSPPLFFGSYRRV